MIAQAQNAFAVAHHDDFDTVEAWIAQDAIDAVLQRKAQKQTARLAKDAAELLTAETHSGRIDNRHQLFDVPGQQRVKQGLVGVLCPAKKHVLLQVRAECAKGVEPAVNLQIEVGHVGRQEAVQIELIALGVGERCAFVEERIVQQLVTAERGLDGAFTSFVHYPGPSKQATLANG